MSEEGDRSIRSILVVGAGIVGLSAAAMFARALPRTRVSVLATPGNPSAVADRLPATLPGAGRFHEALGLDEEEMVRSGVALHRLGTAFEGWGAGETEWLHGWGPCGESFGGVPFDQLWSRARRTGRALPYDRYSAGAALIRAGRFALPAPEARPPLSNVAWGLRLDPVLYRDRLTAAARAAGVQRVEGSLAGVVVSGGGRVAAVRLTGGGTVEADMFVDCSGPGARIYGAVDEEFESWAPPLPEVAIATSTAESRGPLPYERTVLTDTGWTASWPLPGRTLRVSLGPSGAGAPVRPGRRPRPWAGNVLALGDSAVAIDPLHGLNLDLAQRGILLALELLPGRDFHPLELAEYNRRYALVTERVRDFLALHYLRSGRRSGFWGRLAGVAPPKSLARTVSEYEARGRLPFHEEESLTRHQWTAALIGLGILSRETAALAHAVSLEEAAAAMERAAAATLMLTAGMPTYRQYMQAMGGAATASEPR